MKAESSKPCLSLLWFHFNGGTSEIVPTAHIAIEKEDGKMLQGVALAGDILKATIGAIRNATGIHVELKTSWVEILGNLGTGKMDTEFSVNGEIVCVSEKNASFGSIEEVFERIASGAVDAVNTYKGWLGI